MENHSGRVGPAPPLPVAACHVVLVIAGLGAGGAERVVSLIANDWVAAGRRVTVVAFDDEDEPVFHPLDPRVRIVRLGIAPAGGGLAGLLAVARRLASLGRTLAALDPDVTISFLTKINVLTLLASIGSRRRVMVSERNNPRLQRASALWTMALRLLHWRADAIVMQTRGSLECLGRRARARARVIPNPIAIEPVPAPGRPAPVLAATGRLTWQKGFDLLIDAFARIADRFPDWTLVIWGEGELRGELVRLVQDRGLTSRVMLPGNSRSPGDWVGRADAFVLSSRFEGFANVVGEAMAAGLPVASFDCDYGPGEMIRSEENGLLVANGDVAALAAALARLLGDASLRDRLGRAARATGERLRPRAIIGQWNCLVTEATADRTRSVRRHSSGGSWAL